MLIDWNAVGIMGTIAGSVAGTSFFLGRKLGKCVTRNDCDSKRGDICNKLDELKEIVIEQGKSIARIEGKIDGNYRED
jgi:hypothetical protein